MIAGLLSVATFCLLAYGYLVATTIINMVEYRAASANIARLHTQVGELESRYLALGQSMTVEHAHALGFVNVPTPHFVTTGTTRRLTIALVE